MPATNQMPEQKSFIFEPVHSGLVPEYKPNFTKIPSTNMMKYYLFLYGLWPLHNSNCWCHWEYFASWSSLSSDWPCHMWAQPITDSAYSWLLGIYNTNPSWRANNIIPPHWTICEMVCKKSIIFSLSVDFNLIILTELY